MTNDSERGGKHFTKLKVRGQNTLTDGLQKGGEREGKKSRKALKKMTSLRDSEVRGEITPVRGILTLVAGNEGGGSK